MHIRDRIGIDFSRRLSMEDAVAWSIAHGIRYMDCNIDIAPNPLESFDEQRCRPIRDACANAGIQLGLHTLSAVNVAEVSPFLRDAVDRYLRAYIDVAVRLDARWIEVHAGYHFTADKQARMQAGLERLERAVGYAEEKGVSLMLENLNREPDLAEVHYLAHTVEECLYYFDRIDSPHFGWSFTINHATLVPEGIAGFIDAMPSERLREVRLADNNGQYEIHMYPGTGIIDFTDMFRRIEATGFRGHYMQAYGTLEEMLRGREELVRMYPGAS